MTDPREGLVVTHRRYVPYSHAHYAGNLVDGAYALALFGDVATEACIRTDGDEGLFASYSDVQFRAPMRAGDVLSITATVTIRDRDSLAQERLVISQVAATVYGDGSAGYYLFQTFTALILFLAANTSYTYQVRAADAAGNLSGPSASATVTT